MHVYGSSVCSKDMPSNWKAIINMQYINSENKRLYIHIFTMKIKNTWPEV